MKSIKIFFNEPQEFEIKLIKSLTGITGLYFIFLGNKKILYPFKESHLIYVGMSEKKTNSIGNRLSDHYDGQSGNLGLVNYRKVDRISFTYINFEMLKRFWKYSIEDLESYFIFDFVNQYGVYPICNNRTSTDIMNNVKDIKLDIDWKYYE